MKWILLFLMCMVGVSYGQELYDTPSAVQTCQNGKPYRTGKIAKLIGSCPYDQKPEVKWNGKPDGFFTFGDGQRWLHPDKKSWLIFAGSHAALWGVTIFAVRNQATSHEEGHSEYPAMAFMTGIDLLVFKTISPSLSVIGPIWGTQHYLRSGLK